MIKPFNPHLKNNLKYLSNNPIVGLTPLKERLKIRTLD
ncbi:hypothetical protein HPHPA14_0915 [Helicobacter pylori Hp A-14]|nr:hypothetical protein HPHPA14_0915 [Helicobacter pylori Hp A-14]